MLIIADAKIPHAVTAFGHLGEVTVVPTKQMTHETIRNADAILIRSETKINASLLDGTRVRFIGTATIGTDHVDEEYLGKNQIGFASCPGSNANSVAEYVLAAMLECGGRLGMTLRGKTLGVVGHGNTGSRVAIKARALGMHVLLNDPPLARSTGDSEYRPLDALMGADIISLHVPLTKSGQDATFHLFDDRRLRAMKKGSIFFNCSRGPVAETNALKHALETKHFRACVLDVWENEPVIDVDLLRLVTLGSPHIAGYSYDGKLNATKMLQQAMGEFFHIPVPPFEDPDAGEMTEIVLHTAPDGLESLLRLAVTQCYDITEDDRLLRMLVSLPSDEHGDFFRKLRSGYRVRREFDNYVVDGSDLDDESGTALAAIGFKVNDLKGAA